MHLADRDVQPADDFWSDVIEEKAEQAISSVVRDAKSRSFESAVEFEVRWEAANRDRKTSSLGTQFGHRVNVTALRQGWELDDEWDRHIYGCPREFLQGDRRATAHYIKEFHDNGS